MRTTLLCAAAALNAGCAEMALNDLLEAHDEFAVWIVDQAHAVVRDAHAACGVPQAEDADPTCFTSRTETEGYITLCADWVRMWEFDSDFDAFQLTQPIVIRAIRDGQDVLDAGGLERCILGGPPSFTPRRLDDDDEEDDDSLY